VAAEVDDPLAQACVRCEDAVVAVAMDAGRRDQAAQPGEKLEGGEGEDGAAVAGGLRGQVDDLADAGIAVCCGGGALLGPLAATLNAQALKSEGWPGAITFSASADVGSKSKRGVPNQQPPIDPVFLALSLGATFVARSFSGDKAQLVPILKAAIATAASPWSTSSRRA
jgi:hypothetical protein